MNRHVSGQGPMRPPPSAPPAPVAADRMDLGTLFAAPWRHRWLVLIFVVAAALLALQAISNTRPSYFSAVEVLLDTRQERVVGVEAVVSDLQVTNSVVAGEIAVLRSNLLLGDVVDELDLMSHPDFDPRAVEPPGPVARAIAWGRVTLGLAPSGAGETEPMPETTPSPDGGLAERDARNLVIWQVRRNLSVYQSGISYVISISMRAHDPDIAAEIANAVARRYIQDQLEGKQQATQRAIAWLDNRLIELEAQLREAEDSVVDFRARQVLEEGGSTTGVSQQLTEMNRTIVAAREDRSAAQARLAHVRSILAENGPDAAASVLETPRLAALDTEMADLERQRAQLATRLGPRHPDMLALSLAMEDLLRDRMSAIRAGIGDLEAMLAQTVARERDIEEDINDAQTLQVELSRSSIRLSQLERSASAMRQVYESFLSRFQETTQQLEFQRPDARIISEAQPALSPARPRKKLILAVALMLGGLLGVAVAIGREITDRSVRGATDLAELTDRPVLSTLPRVRRFGRRADWQLTELRERQGSGYAEGLRLLRFGLTNETARLPPRIVMVTGAERGVGGSTTVRGLARALAAIGRRVVVVDANLHRPDMARAFGLVSGDSDLRAYLDGEASVEEVIASEVEPGVSVVSSTKPHGNPADLLSSPMFEALLRDLSEHFDVVLLDASPILGTSDATILAGLTDAVVVVARYRRSRGRDVASAIATLEQAGARVVGTVLSHVPGASPVSVGAPSGGAAAHRGRTVHA